MKANRQEAREFMSYRGIRETDIPDIDLYMDQVLTFFDRSFHFFRRDQKENILTKAMINNYVKAGIMDKPAKKKYNKDQLKRLIMIYQLKQILAINDILDFFLEAEKIKSSSEFYDSFLEAETAFYSQLAEMYPNLLDKETAPEVLVNTILSLSVEACAKKRLAEKLLDRLKES